MTKYQIKPWIWACYRHLRKIAGWCCSHNAAHPSVLGTPRLRKRVQDDPHSYCRQFQSASYQRCCPHFSWRHRESNQSKQAIHSLTWTCDRLCKVAHHSQRSCTHPLRDSESHIHQSQDARYPFHGGSWIVLHTMGISKVCFAMSVTMRLRTRAEDGPPLFIRAVVREWHFLVCIFGITAWAK